MGARTSLHPNSPKLGALVCARRGSNPNPLMLRFVAVPLCGKFPVRIVARVMCKPVCAAMVTLLGLRN